MPLNISRSRCRQSWKQGALLLILLSHAVFGSPVVPPAPSSFTSLSSAPQTNTLTQNKLHTSLEEDVFGPTLEERADRKKRLLYETLKKAKQAKLLSLGAASGSAVKSIGKSVFKTVATLGIKAIIFNFLYSKINQVLDFKTRLLNNLEHKNREQNSQAGIGDSGASGSSVSTTTENPNYLDAHESVWTPSILPASGSNLHIEAPYISPGVSPFDEIPYVQPITSPFMEGNIYVFDG